MKRHFAPKFPHSVAVACTGKVTLSPVANTWKSVTCGNCLKLKAGFIAKRSKAVEELTIKNDLLSLAGKKSVPVQVKTKTSNVSFETLIDEYSVEIGIMAAKEDLRNAIRARKRRERQS